MSTEAKPREMDMTWYIDCKPDRPEVVPMIEKSFYLFEKARADQAEAERDAIKAAHEGLLSYLPSVPTEPYEKRMARRIAELEAEQLLQLQTITQMGDEIARLKSELMGTSRLYSALEAAAAALAAAAEEMLKGHANLYKTAFDYLQNPNPDDDIVRKDLVAALDAYKAVKKT